MTQIGRVESIPRTTAGSGSWLFASSPPSPTPSLFGEWWVLRVAAIEGQRRALSLACAEDVTRALRGALLRHAVDPPPAVLSGHTPDGRPLERPHTAFLVLPDERGGVAGAAIVLPRDITPDDYQAVLLAAARWERSGARLWLGRLGAIQLERAEEDGELDPARWTGPARRWASVTPIALD